MHYEQCFLIGACPAGDGFPSNCWEPRALQRIADSGRLNTRFVYPDCAGWIYSLPRGGVTRVRAETLDDTSWLRPTRHIWMRRKQPWVTFGEDDEIFEGQPFDEVSVEVFGVRFSVAAARRNGDR